MPKSPKPSSSRRAKRDSSPSGHPTLTLKWQLLRQDIGEGGARLCLALAALLILAVLAWALNTRLHWSDAVPAFGLRAAGCAVAGALLLFTARRWMPAAAASDESSNAPEPFNPGDLSAAQWTRLALRLGFLAALLIAGYERYPRLEQSLAPHEERALPAIYGTWAQKEDRQMFEATPWSATLFDMSHLGAPTGLGPLAAALDRLSLEAWQESKSFTAEIFSETPLRLPAFVAGLFLLGAVVYLGKSMGAPWTGLTGALLLALHPMTLRLGSEIGGSSLMLLAWALFLATLRQTLEQPNLTGWLKATFWAAACILCQSAGFFAVLAAALWAAASLLQRREFRQVLTLAAFALLAAVPVILFMGPGFGTWLSGSAMAGPPSASSWTSDFLARLLIAFPSQNPFPEDHQGIQWTAWLSHPAGLVLAWTLPILALLGAARACWRGRGAGLYVASPLLAVLLYLGVSHAANGSNALATLALFPLALGAPLILEDILRKPAWLAPAAIALLVLTYGGATREVTQRLRDHDLKSTKDLIEFVHRQDPASITASFGDQAELPQLSYDPGLHVISQVSDLTALVEKAVHEHRSLFVYFAGEHEAAQRYPELEKALLQGCPTSLANGWTARFRRLSPFLGLEEKWTYQIFRLSNAQEVSRP